MMKLGRGHALFPMIYGMWVDYDASASAFHWSEVKVNLLSLNHLSVGPFHYASTRSEISPLMNIQA